MADGDIDLYCGTVRALSYGNYKALSCGILKPNRLGVANEWGSFIARAKYRYPEDEEW